MRVSEASTGESFACEEAPCDQETEEAEKQASGGKRSPRERIAQQGSPGQEQRERDLRDPRCAPRPAAGFSDQAEVRQRERGNRRLAHLRESTPNEYTCEQPQAHSVDVSLAREG